MLTRPIGPHQCTDCERRVSRIPRGRYRQWQFDSHYLSFARIFCKAGGCPGTLRNVTSPDDDRVVAGRHRQTEMEMAQTLPLDDQVALVREYHEAGEVGRERAIEMLLLIAGDLSPGLAEWMLFGFTPEPEHQPQQAPEQGGAW
jgi:hypothetical protein